MVHEVNPEVLAHLRVVVPPGHLDRPAALVARPVARLGVTEVRSAFIVAAVGILLESDQGPGREKVFRDQAEI